MESTPSPHAPALIFLSRQGATHAHLDFFPPHYLVLWTDGSVPVPFGKSGSGVFANCSLCGTEAILTFSVGLVCPSFSTEAFAILQALCWSRQHQQVCHFSSLFLSFPFLTIALFSPPSPLLHLSFYLNLSGRSGRNYMYLLSPPVLRSYNGSLDLRFSRETTRLMSWLDGEPSSCPLQSLVISLFLSLVSTLLFSDWRRTVSSKFFDTHVSSVSTEEPAPPRHARCLLSCFRCNEHSLLLSSYLSRIGRIENPSCNACGHSTLDTYHFILHCPATNFLRRSLFGHSLSLYDL